MRAYQLYWPKTLRVLFVIISISVIILIFDKNFNRQYFMNAPPFPTLAFWQDNRTYQTGRLPPSPITTVDKVNLTNFTLAIAACCRNVQSHLIGFQKNVRTIGGLFKQYRIYLGESDSEDGTLQFIQEWAKNDSDHVQLYTAGQQRWRHFFRTQRLAHCRNTLLQRIHADMPSFDYYLVLDVDVTSTTTFTTNNFLSNFIYPLESWAVMTASQEKEYYDIWALRTWPTMPFDFWVHSRQLSFLSFSWHWIRSQLIVVHTKGIPRDHPLIEIESAFGGAAIYAARYLSDECVYNGWMDHGLWFHREQCEHVAFNQCVGRNAGEGKVFINPRFQNK